ncbi:MAG: enoyl-CoA hydratase [Robiginitomaculum sp.]|nr:MAG: enoyl-CoA hydratase [Robiginitomaculum sp.]
MNDVPDFETILLSRQDRRLTIMLNRPDVLNAFNTVMHVEFIEALVFAQNDQGSDVILLTGAGRAFSAGGDLDQMAHVIENPDLFDKEAENAKRLIFTLLDIEKPIIARINGHAVGLGATIALFCDVIFAAERAKIGDPHVAIGLVAGDGGAIIWPQLIGFARAKEYLLTGALLSAVQAAEIGLINHAVPFEELDARVDSFCDKLLMGAVEAIRWTKATVNIELKRLAHAMMEPGMAYEARSVRTTAHRRLVTELRAKVSAKNKP